MLRIKRRPSAIFLSALMGFGSGELTITLVFLIIFQLKNDTSFWCITVLSWPSMYF